MVKRSVALGTLAVALLASSGAHALTRSSFEAKVRKNATPIGGPVKAVCICKESGAYYRKAGYLTSFTQAQSGGFQTVSLNCVVPIFFSSNGDLATAADCSSNFEVLGR